MADKKRQRLELDLESLFPGDTVDIGGKIIEIRPLGVLQLSIIARKLKGFGASLVADGVTWENYQDPSNLLKIAVVLLEQFPEVIEEASNVDIEDIQTLPIEYVVQLVDKVVEVNMKSREKLEGNFKSLAGRLNMIPGTV